MANVRIKGGARGWPRMPGCHVNCWAVPVSIALTMSQKSTSEYPGFDPERILRKIKVV